MGGSCESNISCANERAMKQPRYWILAVSKQPIYQCKGANVFRDCFNYQGGAERIFCYPFVTPLRRKDSPIYTCRLGIYVIAKRDSAPPMEMNDRCAKCHDVLTSNNC